MGRNMIDFTKLTPSQLDDFKNKYEAYIFDMDGCLVDFKCGPIAGASEALCEIEKNGKNIFVLTDNCGKTLNYISEHITGSFPVIRKDNIMNAGFLLVKYLKEINFNKKIYAMGSTVGVIAELKGNGFDVLYDEEVRRQSVPILRETKFEEGVGAVLIAGDINFNYFKMFKAANYLQNPEVLLLQTHYPIVIQFNPVILGAGAIAPSVLAASGRTETICMGKGSEYSCKYLNSLGHEPQRCLFVGDDMTSDVVAGNLSGMDTMLVLSGTSSFKALESAKEKNLVNRIPTYYANSVADLIKVFKN